ncbi:MAG: hypothetical protein GXP14_10545 [Gammaproteobacteria bacterium]|nr:hypothetical protein [Gammaproteobacteria bacterium]
MTFYATCIAEIGRKQIEYYEFFPSFADKLVAGLGKYLGDEKSVALTTNKDHFQFDIMYRHEGLGFECGRYRIPIMIKFDNLKKPGFLLQRISLYCSKTGNCIFVSINDELPLEIQESEMDNLYNKIYEYLCSSFSKDSWFESNKKDYQATGIGFLANE